MDGKIWKLPLYWLDFLCWYHKWTDICYLTWSFENVAKNCQFQFLDPPPQILLSVSELPLSLFRPPQYCCQFQFLDPPSKYCCQFKFLTPSKLPVSVFRLPSKYCYKFQFLDPPPKYCCQFQFLDPPKLPVSVLRPPQIFLPVSVFSFLDFPPHKYCCQFQFFDHPQILLKVMEYCLKTLQLIIFNFRGGGLKIFYRLPPPILKGNGVVFKNFTINNF